jgi:hypothetical protein
MLDTSRRHEASKSGGLHEVLPGAACAVWRHQPRLCPLAPFQLGSLVGAAGASLMDIALLSVTPFSGPAV